MSNNKAHSTLHAQQGSQHMAHRNDTHDTEHDTWYAGEAAATTGIIQLEEQQ